jgi:hypothetical protein
MGGTITVVVVGVVEAIFGAEKQAAGDENNCEGGQDCFDIHGLLHL